MTRLICRLTRPVLALGLLALPATAQDVDCATAMAQADLNQCAYQDWEEADAGLNDTYQEVVAAYCIEGWDGYCPPTCAASVGSTYSTLDPIGLIGG